MISSKDTYVIGLLLMLYGKRSFQLANNAVLKDVYGDLQKSNDEQLDGPSISVDLLSHMQERLNKKDRSLQKTRQERLMQTLQKGNIPSNINAAFDALFGNHRKTFDWRDEYRKVSIGERSQGRRNERLSAKCDASSHIVQPYGPSIEHDTEKIHKYGFVLSIDLAYIPLRMDQKVLLVFHLVQYLLRHP